VLAAVCLLTLASWFTPVPRPVPFVGLVVLAVVAGVELRGDARSPVAPLVAVLVVASLVLLAGRGASDTGARLAVAIVVAVTASATAAVIAATGARVTRWWSPLLAAAAAAAAAAVFDARPTRAGALTAALAFEVLVLTSWSRLLWSAPVVCAALALAGTGAAVGTSGVVCFGVGLAAIAVGAALWGSPPWTSGVVGPWAARRAARWCRRALVASATVAVGTAAVASVTSAGRAALVPLAAAASSAVLAMAAVAVRQWRFVPTRRAVDAVLVVTAACSVVVAYPGPALSGDAWAFVIVAAAVGVGLAVAWPVARLLAMARPGLAAAPSREVAEP
jgi:hypothetical protein